MQFIQPYIGHHAIQQYLQLLLERHTVPQANLWVGPQHVGKSTLLHNILLQWLCQTQDRLTLDPCQQCASCTALLRDQHPNLRWLMPIKDSISIEAIRPILQEASQSRLHAGPYCIVIEQADRLTSAAANALLKLLEEPSQQVHIFLLTAQLDQVLSTIQSRCSMVQFHPVAATELCTLTTDPEVVALAHGLPGLVQQWSDPTVRKQLQLDITRWLDIFTATQLSERSQLAEVWLKNTKNSSLSKSPFALAQHVCRDILFIQLGRSQDITFLHERSRLQQLAARSTMRESLQGLSYLTVVQQRLHVPLQMKLIFDNFLLTIYRSV